MLSTSLIAISILSLSSTEHKRVQEKRNDLELVFEDHFDSLNTTYWTAGSLRDKASGDIVPGAKGAHLLGDQYDGYITAEDVYVEDGSLVLRNQKRDYQGNDPGGEYKYTSGWVMSMHKLHMNKGYIEVRARFPSGDKVWPAIWLISENLVWCPEWDLFEYFGYRQGVGNDIMGNHLCHGAYPDQQWEEHWIQNFDDTYQCEEWHTYGFEWTADKAIWYIDEQLVHTLDADSVAGWPDEDMYLILNNGTRTEAPDTHTEWPNYLKIDYVKIYE